MTSREFLKTSLSALAAGLVCAGLAYFALAIYFPPEAPAKISLIAFLGALIGAAIGLFMGWSWVQNKAGGVIVDVLIRGNFWVFAIFGKAL